jgi:DNA invertase Pin-like site-specific DNA recombinase
MNKPAAIYARVSSDRQKENQTIASQTAALTEYAESHGYLVPAAWVFEDDGYSGASLIRPGLEALRDLAAQGQIKAALVYSPDRLSRRYAFCCRQQASVILLPLLFLMRESRRLTQNSLTRWVGRSGRVAQRERSHQQELNM